MRIKLFVSVFCVVLMLVGCNTDENSNLSNTSNVETENHNNELDEAAIQEAEEKEAAEKESEEVKAKEAAKKEKADKVALESGQFSFMSNKEYEYIIEYTATNPDTGAIEISIGEFKYLGEYEYDNKWEQWEAKFDDEESSIYLIGEDEAGLYTGYPESEYYTDIEYPLEEGKVFYDWEDEYTITKVNGTVATVAGEFINTVEVLTPNGSISYFAPDIGFVKSVNKEGEVTAELIEINPR